MKINYRNEGDQRAANEIDDALVRLWAKARRLDDADEIRRELKRLAEEAVRSPRRKDPGATAQSAIEFWMYADIEDALEAR